MIYTFNKICFPHIIIPVCTVEQFSLNNITNSIPNNIANNIINNIANNITNAMLTIYIYFDKFMISYHCYR